MTLARVSTTFFILWAILISFVLSISFSAYRSAIFTHSDKQENIAKQITKEIMAKHFAPKGQSSSRFVVVSHPTISQERKSRQQSYLLLIGGMQRSTTNSTYPRIRLDTNAQLINYTGDRSEI
jgi:hypothetical protein